MLRPGNEPAANGSLWKTLARPAGESSNRLFEAFVEWSTVLGEFYDEFKGSRQSP
jgi:hypothetical protein